LTHLPHHPVLGPGGVTVQQLWGSASPLATPEALLAWALWHVAHGWRVGPCEIGGKRPVTVHGFKGFTSDRQTILNWAEGRYAGHNWAVATWAPGPDVLDIDVRPGGSGWESFNKLKAAGLLSGAQRLVRTPSGGLHVYFAGTTQRCGSLRGLHLDFKSQGGYVLVPPSQIGGRPYELLDDRASSGATFDWAGVVRLLRPPPAIPVRRHSGGGSVARLPAWVAQQAAGSRNNCLFWAACRAAEAGDQAVLVELVDAGVQAGLDRAEASRTVASAARKVSCGG
jgi:hypothetical protein